MTNEPTEEFKAQIRKDIRDQSAQLAPDAVITDEFVEIVLENVLADLPTIMAKMKRTMVLYLRSGQTIVLPDVERFGSAYSDGRPAPSFGVEPPRFVIETADGRRGSSPSRGSSA